MKRAGVSRRSPAALHKKRARASLSSDRPRPAYYEKTTYEVFNRDASEVKHEKSRVDLPQSAVKVAIASKARWDS
jgi:hypothetical protein